MSRSTIRARLIRSFTVAILIPSLLAVAVGVQTIRRQVYAQAQAQVNSDLQGAREICSNFFEQLQSVLRIHATRRVIYDALVQGDRSGLEPEMSRVRESEGLDMLILTDLQGRVVYRAHHPENSRGTLLRNDLISGVLKNRTPRSGILIMTEEELQEEGADLAKRARMEITPTPMAAPSGKNLETSGMAFLAAAPIVSAGGRFLGVLCGGVLINRSYGIVDKIRAVVFKEQQYEGREIGTATLFQDDVRISTNVRNADGTRAITTRVSAEVAEQVLRRGRIWQDRAFVVNDWYLAAYAPLTDVRDRIIGMLYVGTLERPFQDQLWGILVVFLGITLLGVALVVGIAIVTAGRISRPIHAVAGAAQKVAGGDYRQTLHVDSNDEIGYLTQSFNEMTAELARTHQELQEWTETLESRVEERTAQLKAIQRNMLQAEKLAAVGKLAAGVAHEINNPLTGILTNSSLLLEDTPADDPRREELQVIVDETLRCRKIVKGLLDFARQTPPHKQLVNLNQVVEDILNLVRNQSLFRNLTLELLLDPDLPAVMADRDQLRQVLLNILINAAEAMPQGGQVKIFSGSDPGGKNIWMKIADSGPGIDEEARNKIFEPFFTTKRTGTGLGLAIAYGIMEQHKGTIEIDSKVGQGTTLTLNMPGQWKDFHE